MASQLKSITQSVGILLLSLLASAASASDFIEDMPQLQPDADRAGAMVWTKPGANRAAYTRVMLEPVTIFISPESKYKGLSAEELATLSQTFLDTMTKTLEPEVPVVNQAGPGVLYLRVALTNVNVAKKKRGLLGYTPIGFVATTVKDAVAGPSISLQDAVFEVEALDSTTGERLGVVVDKAPKTEGDNLSWDSITKTIVFYAERYKARMHNAGRAGS
jgi:hypothetical protein